ncbi:MAG: hypothetical protein IAF58_20820 [Leptolyngbya sp.]|nr:hypothetical protein [Candidatus Melainabacteria bacterium]
MKTKQREAPILVRQFWNALPVKRVLLSTDRNDSLSYRATPVRFEVAGKISDFRIYSAESGNSASAFYDLLISSREKIIITDQELCVLNRFFAHLVPIEIPPAAYGREMNVFCQHFWPGGNLNLKAIDRSKCLVCCHAESLPLWAQKKHVLPNSTGAVVMLEHRSENGQLISFAALAA